MATVTPNFNWPVPTSTDLVKDGATAIEALGDSIDGSLVDLKGGTTGQVLSKTSGTDMDFTWVTSDDANAIQNSIVDAKGDLISATANDTPARLAVGNNGETLVADSSTSTGLRYQGFMTAGKNKVLNSDFSIWQRGTSFSNPTNGTYITDRWFMYFDGSGATRTISQQTFTGDNPSGCNASYYLRWAQTVAGTGGSINAMYSRAVEDVRNFNGQTVTVSFWAKADAARSIILQTYQEFGTGGSGAVLVNSSTFSATTSWTRFSATIAMPSVSGKTIAGNSSITFIVNFPANTAQTIEMTGLQLELGSVATAFQTATGTIQGELAACQRYYWRFTATAGGANYLCLGRTSSQVDVEIQHPVQMRRSPTDIEYGGTTDVSDINVAGYTVSTISFANASVLFASIRANVTVAGLAQGKTYVFGVQTNAFYGFSAEL
jgi:hypothetical protein